MPQAPTPAEAPGPSEPTALAGLTVGLFGLGEAGSWIAPDLAGAGAAVVGYDPDARPALAGVDQVDDPADAVEGADLVLAVTAAADAPVALTQAIDRIPQGAVYADLATASAAAKRSLADTAAGRGLGFVDVALMSTVPGTGLFTPALASGPAADRYVEILAPAGVPVEAVAAEAGVAATRKLLRSVVLKGLAGLVIESIRASTAAGYEDETWANLVAQFETIDEAFLRRMVEGSAVHAGRRLHEMEASVDLLIELGVDPVMTRGTVESLRRLPDDGLPAVPASPTGA